jgi:putative oxidoreductase
MAFARHRIEDAQQVQVETVQVGQDTPPSLMAVMMAVPSRRWKCRRNCAVMRGDGGAARHRNRITEIVPMSFDEKATTPYAAFLLRVTLGIAFLAHGLLLKIATFGFGGVMGYFGSIGYPPVFGAIVAIAETAAGIALILGVWTRLVSILAVPIMIGATIQHLPNGWIFSARGGGWEFPAMWTVLMLVQAGLGAGAFALDPARLLGRTPQTARA